MPYVADLHIHSKYANACSPQIDIPNLAKWAKYKGVDLVGTGDCLHPEYLMHLERHLKERGDGLSSFDGTKFMLTTEVACIYTEAGKSRRIHIVLGFPSFGHLHRVIDALKAKGCNLASDGRPILGLSVKQLSELVLKACPNAMIIPAHIWTPWFSLYGANSGYDFFGQCFGEFAEKVYAVETGISSDPAMNWRIADLDNKTIVSFSDMHSLPRLARECTLFKGNLSFDDLVQDLQTQNLLGTIEFFPEEGKYHFSGHRNCGVVMSPEEINQNGEICPKCGKKMTIGVTMRIDQITTRTEEDLGLQIENGITTSTAFPKRPGFRMLVQLEEIIAQALNLPVASTKVKNEYERMVTELDAELKILTKVPIDLLNMFAGERITEGIDRVRKGLVTIEPGYDNTYGVVKIFEDED